MITRGLSDATVLYKYKRKIDAKLRDIYARSFAITR